MYASLFIVQHLLYLLS